MDDPLSGIPPVDSVIKKHSVDHTEGVSHMGSSKPASSVQETSSLKASESKGLEQQREMAGVPLLPPPHQIQDYDFSLKNILAPIGNSREMMTAEEADLLITAMMQEATGKLLTAWISGLQKDAEHKQIADKLAQQRDQVTRALKMAQQLNESNIKASSKAARHATTYGLLVSAGLMALGLGANVNALGLVSFATLKEIVQIVASIAPTRVDGIASSIVSVFGGGIITQAGLMTLKSESHNKQKYNFEFAKNYAVKTLSIVNGNQIQQAVATVFATAGNDVITAKVTLANIALLAQPLAFAYHLETGSLSGLELAGMLQGKMVFDKDDPRTPLITAINDQIGRLPADKRVLVVEKLMAYFDSKPDLDELSEPANAILSLFGSMGSISTPIVG